jgi:hypothetical protein
VPRDGIEGLSDALGRRSCDTDDMRQPYGPGDIIEIDVIDAEPGVFGPSAAAKSARERRPRPKWLVPTAIGLAVVCGGVAMVWRPWEVPPEWRTFGPAAPPTSSLTDQLVLTVPNATAISLDMGQNLDADEPTPLGYVFTVPGGSYEYEPWALFHSRASNGAGTPAVSESTDLVRGLQADVRHVRVRTTVTWGPIGGNYWDAETNRFDDGDALAFANTVGVVAGLPAVGYGYDLGALRPLGDVKTLARVEVLTAHLAGEPVLSKFTPTVVSYNTGAGTVTVASIATNTDGLAMARFYLGQGLDVTVHGLPGALIETRRIGKVVVWHEGNRLVVVTANAPDSELLTLAESVGPATADEWNKVIVDTSEPIVPDIESDIGQPAETVDSGTLRDGNTYRISITLGNPTVICAHLGTDQTTQGSCVFATPLSPALHAIHDDNGEVQFVVAVIPHDSSLVLRFTTTTGDFIDTPAMRMLSDSSLAMAAPLPHGATYELVEASVLD